MPDWVAQNPNETLRQALDPCGTLPNSEKTLKTRIPRTGVQENAMRQSLGEGRVQPGAQDNPLATLSQAELKAQGLMRMANGVYFEV